MFLTEDAIAQRYEFSLHSLADIADAYYFQGRLDDAFRLWQTSEPLLTEREVQAVEQMRYLLRYGDFLIHYYFLSNREEKRMFSVVQQARLAAEALQDTSGIATALDLTGQTLYFHNLLTGGGDLAEARTFFQQASALREQIGDLSALANSLFYTGMTYIFQGQAETAREYYQRTLALAEEHGNTWAASEANRHLADVSMSNDRDYEQALHYALRSLALREEIKFKRAFPSAQLLVSDVYVERGDFELALAYCQQAEQLAQEMNQQTSLVNALMTRGEIASRQGQLVEARSHLEKAAALARELNIAFSIAQADEKLAQLAHKQPG
ncbi:MAG TPA: tetratricopeptide repeat protein [Ktedonobacteraceae bacterium]|nr:tetratricopeptide repeat protein [Ktedonobacteraceae bacterium]